MKKVKAWFGKHKYVTAITLSLISALIFYLLFRGRGSNAASSVFTPTPQVGGGSPAAAPTPTDTGSQDGSLLQGLTQAIQSLGSNQQDTSQAVQTADQNNQSLFAGLGDTINQAVTSIGQTMTKTQSQPPDTTSSSSSSSSSSSGGGGVSLLSSIQTFLSGAENAVAGHVNDYYAVGATAADKSNAHTQQQLLRGNVFTFIKGLDPKLGYSVSKVDSGQGYQNVVVKDPNGATLKY